MTSRLCAVAGWLAAGHAILFGLYWTLLSIPESNLAMLAASALTVFLMLVLGAWVEAVGILAWRQDLRPRDLPRLAVRGVAGVWLATALFVVLWYLTAHAGVWWHDHEGEIDAWLMANAGWANTGKVHAAFGWLVVFVRITALSLAVALASSAINWGFGSLRRAGWLRAGLLPVRLLALVSIVVVFFWLPSRGVNWRPAWLTPNWQETLFVGVKLGVLYLVASIGSALVLGLHRLREEPAVTGSRPSAGPEPAER